MAGGKARTGIATSATMTAHQQRDWHNLVHRSSIRLNKCTRMTLPFSGHLSRPKKTSAPEFRSGGGSSSAYGAQARPRKNESCIQPRSGAVRQLGAGRSSGSRINQRAAPSPRRSENGMCDGCPRLQRRDRGGFAPPSLLNLPRGRPTPGLFSCQSRRAMVRSPKVGVISDLASKCQDDSPTTCGAKNKGSRRLPTARPRCQIAATR